MISRLKKHQFDETILYNSILSLSRNKLFYLKLGLDDTFQNRVYLIFLHISFLFIKLKIEYKNKTYKEFYQRVFNKIFYKIEMNMREIGYGDMLVNKNMKFLTKSFYSILLNCENYNKKKPEQKNLFLFKHLTSRNRHKNAINADLVNYFDKYRIFCIDLSFEKVLKGDLNFNYK